MNQEYSAWMHKQIRLSEIFPIEKIYHIYFFFLLCAFGDFVIEGAEQVGLLFLIYDNYLRYSTVILILCYMYPHIIYISCASTISGFVPGAVVPMERQQNMA